MQFPFDGRACNWLNANHCCLQEHVVNQTTCSAPRTPVPESPAAPGTTPEAARTLSSAELLGGRQAVEIEHQGTRYVLRATRSGKLILTK